MYSYKQSLQAVIGKTIRSIVFRSGTGVSPETQLFLVFEDDTYYEFYGQEMGFVRTLSEGDTTKAMNYARKFSSKVHVVDHKESRLHD
jgi:hypothetical protein